MVTFLKPRPDKNGRIAIGPPTVKYHMTKWKDWLYKHGLNDLNRALYDWFGGWIEL